MNKKTAFWAFFVYSVVILLVFGDLVKAFFLQDEWATFGNVIFSNLTNASWLEIIFPIGGLQHFFPLSRLLPKLMFDWFGLNFYFYVLLGLLFHLGISFLVFWLSWLLLAEKRLAFLAGLLFAVSSIGLQVITWVGASLGTLGAAFFLMLALVFWIKFLKTKAVNKSLANFSLLSLIVSLGFKETSIFLFAFLPICWLILGPHQSKKILSKKNWSQAKKILGLLLILGGLYFGLRIMILLNAPAAPISYQALVQPVNKVVYIYRLLATPTKAISQSLVPVETIIGFAKNLMKLAYPQFVVSGQADPFIAESMVADIISYTLALVVLFLAVLAWRYLKLNKQIMKAQGLILSLSFIAFGAIPFVLIPGQAGYFSLIEGRHLYILVAGSSLFLVITFSAFSCWLNSKISKVVKIDQQFLIWGSILILVTPLLIYHGRAAKSVLGKIVKMSQVRKSVLNQIVDSKPVLPQKVIFYIESDKAFYGLPPEEKILPFQSGLGQTILVWYFNHGDQLPSCFFRPEDDFLFAITEEGYRECQGRGFGYFRKYDSLFKAVQKNNFNPETVIAFSFNSQDNSLMEITSEIKEKLIKSLPRE